MKFKEKYNKKEIKLLKNAVRKSIEDRECSQDELNMCKNKIAEYIMSQSSKNGAVDKMMMKYSSTRLYWCRNWCYYARRIL